MSNEDDRRREEIKLLLASGLKTEVYPRADTHEQVQAIVARLQAAKGDLRSRLAIGGFTLAPGGRRVVVGATLDNLLKGAATQAMQNLNLAFGFDECTSIIDP